jgi:transposase-like protein
LKHIYTAEQEAVMRDTTITNYTAADLVGVSEASIRRWRKAHGVTGTPAPKRAVKTPARTGDPSREELLEAEVKELRAAARKERSATVAQQRILDQIGAAIASADIQHVVPSMPPPNNKFDAHHRQAVLLSDWHGGEVVKLAETGGLNEFNFTILEERVENIEKALLAFKRVRPALTGLDLWCLGDMVSGNIHDEIAQTNEFPIAEQSVRVGQLLAGLIARLAPHDPEVWVGGVPGNHGRTQKPHASKRVFDSWDWVAYHIARAQTSQIENVHWEIPDAGMIVREIAGRKVLLFHGDGIKSSMQGVPWGGVMRRTNELLKQYASMGINLDGFALGHYHQLNVVQSRIFMNGSAVGTNEYGVKNFGGGEPPRQLLLTWDEKRGRLTDSSYLDLA